MKCISCGGEISFADEVCPYCGRPLTETAGHRADVKKYKNKNERTKKLLRQVIAENIPMGISATGMLLLMIGLAVEAYIIENAYHFKEDARRREAMKHQETYVAELQRYLDAGDYTALVAFCEYHKIPKFEAPYDKYALLLDMAEYYDDLVGTVESSVIFGEDAKRYRPESDVFNCRMAISIFYREYDYKKDEIKKDPCKDYIYDMREKADMVLESYLGLDKKGRAAYFEGSENKQEAYLEEVIIGE